MAEQEQYLHKSFSAIAKIFNFWKIILISHSTFRYVVN